MLDSERCEGVLNLTTRERIWIHHEWPHERLAVTVPESLRLEVRPFSQTELSARCRIVAERRMSQVTWKESGARMATSRTSTTCLRCRRTKRSQRRWIPWLLAVSASFCGAVSGEGFEAVALATRLIEENPTELTELEAIFGNVEREGLDGVHTPIVQTFRDGPVERVELMLDIDMFHKDLADPDQSLAEWRVVFRDACPRIHQLVEERLDPPTRSFYELPYGVLAYRSAFVERCTLAWYRLEPKQVPFRSAAETTALRTALIRLLSKRVTRSRIEKLFGSLAFDADWNEDGIERPTWSLAFRPAGADDPDKVSFSFDRSLPATDALLTALGFERPVVMSPDVHMQTRELVNRPRFTNPRVRGRRIRVWLAHTGLERIEVESKWLPPSLIWRAKEPRILGIDLVKDRRRR